MTTTPADERPAPPTLGEATLWWLKLGFLSFGGPAGQIALMHRELVERRRWISEGRFLHALNYCMLLPGPEAQQLATYVGWLMHRTPGGLLAGGLFVLPSLAILIGLSWVYVRFGDVPAVAGMLYGIKPAVTALVLHASWRIGRRALRHRGLWLIATAAFVAISAANVPFPLIVIAAASIGAIGGRVVPNVFAPPARHARGTALDMPAVIDDDTPTPPHARYSRVRLAAVLGTGVALWAAAMTGLVAFGGVDGLLAQMGGFFTKAAFLTFGGAYAVLPYVFQGTVVEHHWVTAAQMMDGLALGETTPGPLIMVVAFVAFVGGWTQPMLGADAPVLVGVAAATAVTFFTFLPSFVFILAGGPLVEATHGRLGFTAPLTAVTAAVVGVIANLALFFAYHVLWPHGLHGRFDVVAAGLAVAAAIALFRFEVGVIALIATSALAGLLLSLARGLG